jgi:RNA-directed DNA polymerase
LRSATDLNDLAGLIGCSGKQLGYYIYKRPIRSQYKQFTIRKKRGGSRTISAPATNLKIIQKNIARALAQLRDFKPCVTGYVSGRDIRRNANPHVSQATVLNVDLEDFFGSINFGRIYGMLSKPPYSINPKIAAAIAKACTLDNILPQGAPSSPIISNLICSKMDSELTKLASTRNLRYTRYADDLTFSSSGRNMPLATLTVQPDGTSYCELSPTLTSIIESNGFRINLEKVRLSPKTRRQEVTGLIVNRRLNVKRRLVREVRAMLHAWRKFGVAAAQVHFFAYSGRSSNFEAVIRGKIGFIGQIRGRPDSVFRKLAGQFNSLATGPKISTTLSPSEIAKQAVWVIENGNGEQGTAFFADGFGLLTCNHCLGPSLKIYHPADHTKTFPVKVIKADPHRDIAILNVPTELSGVVPIPIHAGAAPADGSPITLLGYPSHHAARPIRIEAGTLLRTYPRSGVSYLEITSKIVGGNSGGPILNENFEVIGIAVLGLNGEIDLKSTEFLAVNATEISKL